MYAFFLKYIKSQIPKFEQAAVDNLVKHYIILLILF